MSRPLAPPALVTFAVASGVALLLALAPPAEAGGRVRTGKLPPVSLRPEPFTPADEAGLFVPFDESQRVRFAEVLARPDDVPLNFRYAKTQVHDGDLKGAASTLERILMVEPELPRVRLFYGVVLYRLGNLDEASRELSRVAALRLSPSLAAEVDGYLERIERQRRRRRARVSLTFGSQYDTNRSASPSSESALFADTRVPLAEDSLAEDDFALLGIVRGELEQDLPVQGGHQLLFDATLFDSEQLELTKLTLQAAAVGGGALYRAPWFDVRAKLLGSFVALDREPYVYSGGGSLRLEAAPLPRLAVHLEGRSEYQRFEPVASSRVADERTGARTRAEAGARYALSPTMRLEGSLAYVDKRARNDAVAHRSNEAALSFTWAWPRGQFALASVRYAYDVYVDAEPFVSSRRRVDSRVRTGLLWGADLGQLLPRSGVAEALSGWTTVVRGEYLDSGSNLTSYDYDSWSAGLLFSRRWDL